MRRSDGPFGDKPEGAGASLQREGAERHDVVEKIGTSGIVGWSHAVVVGKEPVQDLLYVQPIHNSGNVDTGQGGRGKLQAVSPEMVRKTGTKRFIEKRTVEMDCRVSKNIPIKFGSRGAREFLEDQITRLLREAINQFDADRHGPIAWEPGDKPVFRIKEREEPHAHVYTLEVENIRLPPDEGGDA